MRRFAYVSLFFICICAPACTKNDGTGTAGVPAPALVVQYRSYWGKVIADPVRMPSGEWHILVSPHGSSAEKHGKCIEVDSAIQLSENRRWRCERGEEGDDWLEVGVTEEQANIIRLNRPLREVQVSIYKRQERGEEAEYSISEVR